MKPFHEWVRDFHIQAPESSNDNMDAPDMDNIDPELLGHNTLRDGYVLPLEDWTYPCRSCGNEVDLGEFRDEMDELDSNMIYCGGQWCMP